MFKAILIDLDNTIVLYDEPAFYRHYFAALAKTFADIIPPERFQSHLLRGIYGLQKNDGSIPNIDFFMQLFLENTNTSKDIVWHRFESFYNTTYTTLPVQASPAPNLVQTLTTLQEHNTKLVLATNPLYPLTAVQKRLAWIEQSHQSFDHITHIENTSFVKPHPEYFSDICETIDINPIDCLMVGNDPDLDMAAQHAGLKTFLTTDAPPNHFTMPDAPSLPKAPDPNYHGSFSALLSTVIQ